MCLKNKSIARQIRKMHILIEKREENHQTMMQSLYGKKIKEFIIQEYPELKEKDFKIIWKPLRS